ncbi:hypothetical protein ACFOTA_21135 [Chitinophaga sp. GCM10012297]|uniref:Uncharacterized protein n=1 Tax=Chitinophaga chungangae TaxID=2821488 RepID=A0ABS3YJ62_9BACT|nr:hypothetical protein [Chitinophaga chungangae]MBO9154731.1 hypothetical protein [Chitinophaga chungangae]
MPASTYGRTASTVCLTQDKPGRISKPLTHNQKGDHKAKAVEIEEEENELSLFSKHLESYHFWRSFFDDQSDASGDPDDPLPFCEHFSFYSSYKFIIHLVIRI